MKKSIFLTLLCPLLLTGCLEEREELPDPRSIEYNDRAVAMIRNYVDRDDILPDSTALAQCRTRTDTIQLMMKNIVDSCQVMIDSALLYSPDHYFYYAQKASFYACGAYYQDAFLWMNKALEKKNLPELRLGAGMFLQKMGRENEAEAYYKQVIDQYQNRDTLSQADLMNYTFALGLTQQKEKALRITDSLAKDTLLKRQILSTIENPQELIDIMMP